MINPKELRVHNLVFTNKRTQSICIIEGINMPFNQNKNSWGFLGRSIYDRHKASISHNINPFPIPFSKKFSQAFGFEELPNKWMKRSFDRFDIFIFPGLLEMMIDSEEPDWQIFIDCPKTVHQFQNLIYTLTGVEIDLDLLIKESN